MSEEEKARKELSKLEKEHQELEDKINAILQDSVYDMLNLQRIKRQKLKLKDQIAKLRAFLCDDIIA